MPTCLGRTLQDLNRTATSVVVLVSGVKEQVTPKLKVTFLSLYLATKHSAFPLIEISVIEVPAILKL